MRSDMNSYMPVRIFTGEGCIRKNEAEFWRYGKRALIVTGRSSAIACGALDDVTYVLDKNDISYVVFDEISQNPLLIDCMRAGELAAEENCSFIIGIGGGSPLDAAKCISVLAANPGMTREELYSLKWPARPLPVIAVGTTAGTGSEVTKVAVITVPEGRKKSFHHEDIFPAAAFGDPVYTRSLSPEFTASTGIDALAHATESYFSRNANEISRCYSVRAIRLLLPALRLISLKMKSGRYTPAEKGEGGFLESDDRETLYNGSIYGGLAINITGTCLPHTMGYLLTERHGIPHGFACAVFLPAFLEINRKEVPEIYEAFFEATGITPQEFGKMITELIAGVKPEAFDGEIEQEHSRWINNSSIMKGWGNILPETCDEILREVLNR